MKRHTKNIAPVIRRNYEYRIEPNKTQTAMLEVWLETHRMYYNRALEPCLLEWNRSSKSANVRVTSQIDLCKQMARYRATDTYGLAVNQNSIQHTIKRMRDAWDRLSKNMSDGLMSEGKRYGEDGLGVPRFKKRDGILSITFTYDNGVKFLEYSDAKPKLRVTDLGLVKIRFHRPFPDGAVIKQVHLKKDVDKWYAVFSLMIPAPTLPESLPELEVGLDMGLKSFLVSSDGELDIECPKFFRKNLQKIRKVDQALSRRAIKDENNKLCGPQTSGYKRAVLEKKNKCQNPNAATPLAF